MANIDFIKKHPWVLNSGIDDNIMSAICDGNAVDLGTFNNVDYAFIEGYLYAVQDEYESIEIHYNQMCNSLFDDIIDYFEDFDNINGAREGIALYLRFLDEKEKWLAKQK